MREEGVSRRRLLLGAVLVLAAVLLAGASLRRVPEGRILIVGGAPGAPPRVHTGPGWAVVVPGRHPMSWLELAATEHRISLGGRPVALTLRPDPDAPPAVLALLARGGVSEALSAALAHGASDAAGLESALRDRGLLLEPPGLAPRPPAEALGAGDTGLNVLLVAIDGADWDVMEPLMAAGRLPHLERLRSSGAWAVLRSDTPTLSPLLWTTVVTGRPPDEHGIVDFVIVDPETGAQSPITSSFRRVRALWNILTEAGMPVGVVGWWATWPAEAVEGVLVSDRVAFSLFHFQQQERSHGITYPASYLDRVAHLQVEAEAVSLDDVRPFARVGRREHDASTRVLEGGGAQAYTSPLAALRKILASTATYHRIALDLLERGQPRWLAVYYQGLDEVNHRFAHLAPPAHPLADDAQRRQFGGAVEAFYVHQDALLGELLAAVTPDTVVMVLSDHGFANGAERPRDVLPYVEAGRPGRWHTLDGAWLLSGPGVRPGRLAQPVRLDQIAPTVLRLLGLPVADDMSGRAVEAALSEEFRARHPPRRIATYEGRPSNLPAAAAGGVPGGADDEMIARLRSLGYLGFEADTAAGRVPGELAVSANYHGNLGSIFLARGELERAREEFLAALERAPGHGPARGGLIQIDIMQGNLGRARDATVEILEDRAGRPDPALYYVGAQLLARTGQAERGLDLYTRLAAERGDVAQVFTGLGLLRQAAGDGPGAAEAYRSALRRKPDALYALQELYTMETAHGRGADLLPLCAAAIEAAPRSVLPYNWQGLIHRRLGRSAEAEASFRAALEVDPDSVRTLVNLSQLLADGGRPAEAVPLLEHALGLDAERWEARVNLIIALGRTRRLEDAARVFHEADGGDGPPQLLNAMAFAYYLNREPAEARPLLERSLALDPEQPEARRLLGELPGS